MNVKGGWLGGWSQWRERGNEKIPKGKRIETHYMYMSEYSIMKPAKHRKKAAMEVKRIY
jgi:hypothetical protein